MNDAVVAGNIDEVVTAAKGLVEAGLRHLVIWNVGPLASGASAADMLKLAVLVRRLRRLPLPPRATLAEARPTRPAARPGHPDADRRIAASAR
jgi:hypothetical protein